MWAGVEASPHGWPDQIATVAAPFKFKKDSEVERPRRPVGTTAIQGAVGLVLIPKPYL